MYFNKSYFLIYVLLFNMFVGFSYWVGLKLLRDIMGVRNVNKMFGISLLILMDIV